MKSWHKTQNGLFLPFKDIQYPWTKERFPSNRYLPSRRCCCGGECARPSCWGITFTGIVDGDCTDCEVYNKTWYVSYDTETSSWKCTLGAHCSLCGEKTLELTIDENNITVTFDGITWQKATPSTAAAAYCDPHTLTYVSGSGDCDYTDATCSIEPGTNADGICPCPIGCAYSPCEEDVIFFTGTTPQFAYFTFSGTADETCTTCETYDGTYTLANSGGCVWGLSLEDPGSCFETGDLAITASISGPLGNPSRCASAGDVLIFVTFEWWNETHTLGITLASYCGAFAGEDFPINGLGASFSLSKYADIYSHCTWPGAITLSFS